MSETLVIPETVSTGSRIVRGTAGAFLLNVLTYGCLFIGQMLIVRLLPQSEYAEYTVSISFLAILALIADLGMNPLFVRLFAEAEEDAVLGNTDRRGTLLGSGVILRIILSLVVVVLLFTIAPMMYPAHTVGVMSILLLTLFISSRMLIVRSVGEAVLRGLGKYYVAAYFTLADATSFAVLMALATYKHLHVSEVAWIYTLSNVPGFLLLGISIQKWLRSEKIHLRFQLTTMKELLHASVPLALGTAFLTVHSQIDNLLLDKLSTPLEVAKYSATIRLSAAMAPFSLVLAAVTAPELTRFLKRLDFNRAKKLTDLSLRLLLIAGAGIALIVSGISDKIVPFILTAKYNSASPLLIWTGWMLIPIFIGTILMDISVAAGYSWFMTANTAVCMVVVIAGDLLLIPRFGAEGAMTSKLIAVTLGAATMIWLSRKTQHVDIKTLITALLKVMFSALISICGYWALFNTVGEVFSTIVCIALYALLIHFTHLLPISEIRNLMNHIPFVKARTTR